MLGFYVVTGPTHFVAASATDVAAVECNPVDAAVSGSTQGFGLVAGPGVSAFANIVPNVVGSSPTGFTFTLVCTTNPTCEMTYRVVCADLTP